MTTAGRIVAVLALLAAPFLGDPGAGAQEAPPAQGDPRLQSLADCIVDNGRVDALFVVDESATLKETDPDANRVVGIKAALSGLRELRGGEREVDVHVAMAGFSIGFDQRVDWTTLDDDTIDDLSAAAEGFRDRDDGFDTDYVEVVDGARRWMADEATSYRPEKPGCKVLFWFTDGKFDIDDRTTDEQASRYGESKSWAPDVSLRDRGSGDALVEAGRRRLCEPGGDVDAMRAEGIFTVALALELQITPQDSDRLAAIATGRSGSETCGDADPAEPTGAYVPASSVDDLILLMYASVHPHGAVPEQLVGTCPPEDASCSAGTLEFEVDESWSRFNLLALTADEAVDVSLVSPAGERIGLSRDGTTGGSGTTRLGWDWLSPTAVVAQVDLEGDPDTWSGTWKMTFVDRSGELGGDVRNRVSLYVYGDLEARLIGDPVPRKGATTLLDIGLFNAAGQPRDLDALRAGSTLTATIEDGDEVLDTFDLGPVDGRLQIPYEPPVDLATSHVVLRLELVTATTEGVVLPPVVTSFPLHLDNPAGFPEIDLDGETVLRLSSIRVEDGDTEATGTFDIVGDEAGSGCVWLDRSATEIKGEEAGAIAVEATVDDSDALGTSEEDCTAVAPGQRATVTVTATPEHLATASPVGHLGLMLRNDELGETRPEQVRVEFDMYRPANWARTWSVAVALLVAGLVIPLLVLYAFKLATARFAPFEAMRYVSIPVVASASGLRPAGPQVGAQVIEAKTEPLALPQSLRRFEVGGFELWAWLGLSPVAPATGRASRPGCRVVSNQGVLGDGGETAVSLGFGDTWVFAATDADIADARVEDGALVGELEGWFLTFFPSGPPLDAQRERLAQRLEMLPDRIAELVQAAPADKGRDLDEKAHRRHRRSNRGMPPDPPPDPTTRRRSPLPP